MKYDKFMPGVGCRQPHYKQCKPCQSKNQFQYFASMYTSSFATWTPAHPRSAYEISIFKPTQMSLLNTRFICFRCSNSFGIRIAKHYGNETQISFGILLWKLVLCWLSRLEWRAERIAKSVFRPFSTSGSTTSFHAVIFIFDLTIMSG